MSRKQEEPEFLAILAIIVMFSACLYLYIQEEAVMACLRAGNSKAYCIDQLW